MATEVIHTIKTSGGDYSSLSAWESAQQRNLVADDEIAVAECYSGEFTDACLVAGWTTDATRYPIIRNAAGHFHDGSTASGFRVTSGGNPPIRAGLNIDLKVVGIVLLPSGAGTDGIASSNISNVDVSACLIQSTSISTSGHGVYLKHSGTWRIWNNWIWDHQGSGNGGGITVSNSSGTVHAYNNTIHACRIGILQSSGTMRPKNNIVQDAVDDDFSGTMTDSATNISSDATSPQTGLRNISLTFADKANDDFHLNSTDTEALGAGTDLSGDADLSFSDDIDGDARPAGDWDIGADQFVAAATGGVPSGLTLLGVG